MFSDFFLKTEHNTNIISFLLFDLCSKMTQAIKNTFFVLDEALAADCANGYYCLNLLRTSIVLTQYVSITIYYIL
jgi:hypothetical protein